MLINTNTEAGAIYARISHIKDDDQTGVDRQVRICRETSARQKITVAERHVFVDPSRSAWQRNRKRPGWDALLEAIRDGEVSHVIVYHPDRLMRQPWDLEELLRLADERKLMLYGQANRRDLTNSDDRFFLRIEVAHACKSSDDTSRRVLDAQQDALRAGKAHGGRRHYGYSPDNSAIVEEEAAIIQEITRRFLDGTAIHALAVDLNARGIPAATGVGWTAARVRQLIDSPRPAGLIQFREQVQKDASGAYRLGAWPAIITPGEWEEMHRLREQRSAAYQEAKTGYRPYLLRGLVICENCGRTMSGGKHRAPLYVCSRKTSANPQACKRKIGAEKLEEFVTDAAKDILTELSVDAPLAAPVARAAKPGQAEAYEKKLAEIMEMWKADEITTAEYRTMRAKVTRDQAAAQRATVVRPLTALEGIEFGPNAAASFDALPSVERKAAAIRFLISAVRIGPSAAPSGQFDYGRIAVEKNPLHL